MRKARIGDLGHGNQQLAGERGGRLRRLGRRQGRHRQRRRGEQHTDQQDGPVEQRRAHAEQRCRAHFFYRPSAPSVECEHPQDAAVDLFVRVDQRSRPWTAAPASGRHQQIRRHAMKPAQLAHFQQKLLASRADLLRELEALPSSNEAESVREGDQADQSSAETDRDLIAIDRERVRKLLGEVERALVRIENGTYGICEDTGEPIGLKRLEAQPTATLSIEAQEARERRASA